MPAGLQVFGENGTLVLDSNWLLGRIAGVKSVNGSFSFSVDKDSSERVFVCPISSENFASLPTDVLSYSISGSTVSGKSRIATLLLYGVY